MSLEKDHSISLIYQKYLYYFHSDGDAANLLI
ncbi:hypothetical protein A1WQ_00083 [Escherichia coli KTE103]|nr:hypothetical protein A1WQ_00083 [Escherichia coli KTE103]